MIDSPLWLPDWFNYVEPLLPIVPAFFFPTCGCCGVGCPHCPRAPARFEVSLSGTFTGVVAACFPGLHSLQHHVFQHDGNPCSWLWSEDCGGTNANLRLYYGTYASSTGWHLRAYPGAWPGSDVVVTQWFCPKANFSCGGTTPGSSWAKLIDNADGTLDSVTADV